MKTLSLRLRAAAAIIAILGVSWPVHSQQQQARTNVIPLIQMDDVPLLDAIRMLARQADLNIIIDPRVIAASPDSAGKAVPQPFVKGRWENATPERALGEILTNHSLIMVENPATTITRIAARDQKVKPVQPEQVGADTNVIPLVVFTEVPLNVAIANIASHAGVSVFVDPGTSGIPPVNVSVRWQNVTAKQALAALLDNYHLVIIEDPTATTRRLTIRRRGGGA